MLWIMEYDTFEINATSLLDVLIVCCTSAQLSSDTGVAFVPGYAPPHLAIATWKILLSHIIDQ